jgi:hypothetical protein
MLKDKPSWGFWLLWLVAYTALDMVFAWLMHGFVAQGRRRPVILHPTSEPQ